jgi:hypothetical protein
VVNNTSTALKKLLFIFITNVFGRKSVTSSVKHFIDDIPSEQDDPDLQLSEEHIDVFSGVALDVEFQVSEILANRTETIEHGRKFCGIFPSAS